MTPEIEEEFKEVYKKIIDLHELNSGLIECIKGLTTTVENLKQELDKHLIYDHEAKKE